MNPNHPSNKRFVQILDSMRTLSEKKQADYGKEEDPFANVRGGAYDMGLSPWIGAAIRMSDKMRRIQKAARLGVDSLNFDSVEDDLLDIAVYAVIALVLLEEDNE